MLQQKKETPVSRGLIFPGLRRAPTLGTARRRHRPNAARPGEKTKFDILDHLYETP